MRRVNIQLPDDVYLELVKRFGVRGLSRGVEAILREALFGGAAPPEGGVESAENAKTRNVVNVKTLSAETAKTQDVVDAKTQSAENAKTQSAEAGRPATPAQVEAIWNIAWEISSWNDVRDVVSHLAGFPVPDDPSQLAASQASKVIEILGRLNRRLSPKQAKEAERLLRKLAEREGLKPEEAADKYSVPLEASKLKRYHLELLKMLAGRGGSPAPAK
jgi:hypothetical protein